MRSLLCGLLVLAACGGSGPAGPFVVLSPSPEGAANQAQPLVRWGADGSLQYRLRAYADEAATQMIEEQLVRGTEARLSTGLADGQRVWVEVEGVQTGARTPLSSFRVVLVPPTFPAMRVVRHDRARSTGGYKLFNILDIFPPAGEPRVGGIVLVNAAGEIVWVHLPADGGAPSDARAYADGTLTFFSRVADATSMTSAGYEITWEGQVLWQTRPGALVHHELGPGPGGGHLYMTYLAEEWDGVSYEGDGLELVDPVSGDVIWTWSIFDHFHPADFQGIPEAEFQGLSRLGRDWSHANAAVWDPTRDPIWVSIRHFSRIIGVEYPCGDVRVTLGTDGLGGPAAMSYQHAPEVQADGSILFWDNGNHHVPRVSRARMVSFDETTGAYEELFSWQDSPPFFDFAVGDADRMPNGNVLVTAGVSGRVIEVTLDGRIAWELALEGDRHWIYRCRQVPEEWIPDWIVE